MICYVCGFRIPSNEYFIKKGDNTRHAWHGIAGQRPYITEKPTLRDAFAWLEREGLVITSPTGFDPWMPGRPRLSDLIDEATWNRAKIRSIVVPAKNLIERTYYPERNAGMSIGPLNRGR